MFDQKAEVETAVPNGQGWIRILWDLNNFLDSEVDGDFQWGSASDVGLYDICYPHNSIYLPQTGAPFCEGSFCFCFFSGT